MTERTDHVAKALDLIDPARITRLDTDAYLSRRVSEAQVHATLALVEQQRIANVIALHRHEVEYDIGGWNRLYLDAGDGPELNDNIREGLGL